MAAAFSGSSLTSCLKVGDRRVHPRQLFRIGFAIPLFPGNARKHVVQVCRSSDVGDLALLIDHKAAGDALLSRRRHIGLRHFPGFAEGVPKIKILSASFNKLYWTAFKSIGGIGGGQRDDFVARARRVVLRVRSNEASI